MTAARPARFAAVALAVALLTAPPAAAQEGAGSAGAQVLQLHAGSRAAALSGAYAAQSGDSDVIFYNAAGLAGAGAGAGLSYQRYATDVALTSASGVIRLGTLAIGIGGAFLDAGEVQVVEPDPAFGGQRGRPTGAVAGASESAVRLALALPLAAGRLRLGGSAGFVASDLAGLTRSAALFDLGAQLALPHVTLAAALRNLGGSLSGAGGVPARLPAEVRAGVATGVARGDGFGASLHADVIRQLREGTTAVAAGLEAGLLPAGAGRIGAVARLGYRHEDGAATLGGLRLGAGVSVGAVAVDYAYEDLEILGAVHRVGVRWSALRR